MKRFLPENTLCNSAQRRRYVLTRRTEKFQRRMPFAAILSVMAGSLILASQVQAQTIGPGTRTTQIAVSSGTTTVVGSTTVILTGATAAANVSGGVLVLDTTADPSPGPISIQTATGPGLRSVGDGTIQVPNAGVNVQTSGGYALQTGTAAGSITVTNGGTFATTGDGAYAVRSDNGTITLDGASLVMTQGANAYGLFTAVADSTINFGNGSIRTTGQNAHAVRSEGGAITLNGPTIITQGSSARGLSTFSSALATAINLTNGSIETAGQDAVGAYATATNVTVAASKITLNNVGITTHGVSTASPGAAGVNVSQASSSVNATDLTILTEGNYGYGVNVSADGKFTHTGPLLSVTTRGANARGLHVTGTNSLLDASATDAVNVTTTGGSALAVSADNGAPLTLKQATLTTGPGSGANAVDSSTGAQITAETLAIITTGPFGRGLYANTGGIVDVGTATISTTGDNAYGVHSTTGSTSGTSIAVDDLTVSSTGATAYGVFVENNTTVTLGEVSITTSGASAAGIVDDGTNASLTLNGDTTIDTQGNAAHGLWVRNGAHFTQVAGKTLEVTTGGNNAEGVVSSGSASQVTLDGAKVATTGATAHGLAVLNGGGLTVQSTPVKATGTGAAALFVQNTGVSSTTVINDSTLQSGTGPTVVMAAGPSDLQLTNVTASGTDQWLQVGGVSAAQTTLTAIGSTLTGSAITNVSSNSALTLTNSTWNLAGNSNLSKLTNHPTGLVDFAAPVSAVFKTLTVNDYDGLGGTLALNTYLGSDGSPSDKLVIDGGAATGVANKLRITNAGGPGAITTGKGILVVEAINGATIAPGAFTLDHTVIAGGRLYSLNHNADGNIYLITSGGGGGSGTPIPALSPIALLLLPLALGAAAWRRQSHSRQSAPR